MKERKNTPVIQNYIPIQVQILNQTQTQNRLITKKKLHMIKTLLMKIQ